MNEKYTLIFTILNRSSIIFSSSALKKFLSNHRMILLLTVIRTSIQWKTLGKLFQELLPSTSLIMHKPQNIHRHDCHFYHRFIKIYHNVLWPFQMTSHGKENYIPLMENMRRIGFFCVCLTSI